MKNTKAKLRSILTNYYENYFNQDKTIEEINRLFQKPTEKRK